MIELGDVLTSVKGATAHRTAASRFTRASIDTRDITGGELFFAVSGPARDGHDFVAAAVEAGAGGIVVSRAPADVPGAALGRTATTVIQVPDTVAALQSTAAAVRRRSRAAVIAVTGSAGKTTAKTLIAHVLDQSFGDTLSNRASFNNHLGVPLTLAMIDPGHEHVVAEIGTNHRGEIAHLTGLVDPEVSVVTNVGFAHLGNFNDQAELAQEKTDLLRLTRPGGTWILNGDDALLLRTAQALPEAAHARVVRIGLGPGNDLQAVDVAVDVHGTRGAIQVDGKAVPFFLPAPGRHFAYAAMLAVAVARAYGVDPEVAVEALRSVELPPGRATLRRLDDRMLMLDDSYNGSPDAMLSSLDLLASLPGSLKVAVLGEMRELGDFSVELHERVGMAAAASATHLVTVGTDAGPLRLGAQKAGLAPERMWDVNSARDALAVTRQVLATHPGEAAVVLAKGSRFMHMERVHLGLAGHTVACALAVCTLHLHCGDCPRLEVG
ncbi:MAG: UDP-N-acetylmuramoyl-tripeptide--D-alanyl-D-alanine ligase [Nocardioides sp.]